MTYRIAAVSFLNTVPLIESFTDGAMPGVALVRALPSRLADLLATGEADVALLPVVELLRARSAGIVGRTGICCNGPVSSVKLFHRGGLARLRRIRVDRGSRTSVALLEVLLREAGYPVPASEEFEPQPDAPPAAGEGHLVIGDRCFACDAGYAVAGVADLEVLDLGEAWRAATGLPFVFAAWAAAPDLPARLGRAGVAELGALLDRARDHGLANLPAIAEREAARPDAPGGLRADPAAIRYYLQESLDFVLDAPQLRGLERFRQLCVKHGIVPDGGAPVLL